MRVGEAARRHVRLALAQLQEGDARVVTGALAACRGEELPLAELGAGREVTVFWRNTPRVCDILVAGGEAGAAFIANRALALAEPGHAADLLLVVVPPFSQMPAEIWREVRELLDKNGEARWKSAVLCWTPRVPLREEWALARECAAHQLLESDPLLLDNRRGRAILAHLKNGAAQREAALARVAVRLLREGKIVNGAGQSCEAGELLTGAGWVQSLESLAEFALSRAFPSGESLAPRLRILTAANAESLCLELLRRPHREPFFAPSLERVARALAEPLGIAKSAAGRWQMAPPVEEIGTAISTLAAAGAPLGHIEAALAKSAFGLCPEQTHMAVCALLRGGELEALSARGEALAPTQIGMPLRRAVRALRPGTLLDEASWASLRRVVGNLTGEQLSQPSFSEQERARALLLAWRDSTQADAELAQARLNQLRKTCGSGPAQWPRCEEALAAVAHILEALSPGEKLLERAGAMDDAGLFSKLQEWRAIAAHFEKSQSRWLAGYSALRHPALAFPKELASGRAALLTRFACGEALLNDVSLPDETSDWLALQGAACADWHRAQHDQKRFVALREFLQSDALRSAARLAQLTSRNFSEGHKLRGETERAATLQCTREGAPPAGQVVCPQCRLLYGQLLELPEVAALTARAERLIISFRAALAEPLVRELLTEHSSGRALLAWSDSGGALLPLLDDETLQLLNHALRPRRKISRSLALLVSSLKLCRTRREYLQTFTTWLDGGESIGENDEVRLEPND